MSIHSARLDDTAAPQPWLRYRGKVAVIEATGTVDGHVESPLLVLAASAASRGAATVVLNLTRARLDEDSIPILVRMKECLDESDVGFALAGHSRAARSRPGASRRRARPDAVPLRHGSGSVVEHELERCLHPANGEHEDVCGGPDAAHCGGPRRRAPSVTAGRVETCAVLTVTDALDSWSRPRSEPVSRPCSTGWMPR